MYLLTLRFVRLLTALTIGVYSGVGLSNQNRLLFVAYSIKFDQSVADRLVAKNEIVMLKSPQNPNKKPAIPAKMVAVIKNGHTAAELNEMGERWVNHEGPYLTLAETIAIEKAGGRRILNSAAISSDTTRPDLHSGSRALPFL